METSFFGFNIAMSGLFASQQSLNVAGHNISNANTPGYSRQVTVQRASQPQGLLNGAGMIGTGTEITHVQRIRNEFLDYKYWNENVDCGEWETKSTSMSELETVFGVSASGKGDFSDVISTFYASLQDLSTDPSSDQARAVVKEDGVALCKYLNNTATQLQQFQQDSNNAVKIDVDQVNSYARQITALNEQIYKSELDGNVANDLRDQRTELVTKLSKLVNVQANEVVVGTLPNGREDKRFQVTVNGTYLVNHFTTNELESYEDAKGMYRIRWKESQNEMEPKSGELKGYMDIRDGNGENGSYKGIPYYLDRLNEFARKFAKTFNEGVLDDGTKKYAGHAGGVGKDGSTGIRFFTYDDKSSADFMAAADPYENITAFNLTVSSDIQNDPSKIAAASAGDGAEDNGNVQELINMRNETGIFVQGTPEDYMKSLISTMGVDSQQAERVYDHQNKILQQIDKQRMSDSGVSLDEEMSNLIRYQQAYNASAKMISVMDEIYDMTINRMGMG